VQDATRNHQGGWRGHAGGEIKYLMLGAITEAGQQLQGPDRESWMAQIGAWYEKHAGSGELADAGYVSTTPHGYRR